MRRSLGEFSHAFFLATMEWRLRGFGKDLVHGLRSLRSRPGFALVALLTLTLGIGANTFLYVSRRAFSFILFLTATSTVSSRSSLHFRSSPPRRTIIESMALADFRAIEKESRTLTSFIAFDLGNRDLGGIAEPQRLLTAAFWGDAFKTLGMAPSLDRDGF